ncbi:MAG: hypothetical protein ACYC5A_11100 [Thermoleophilia bacterium]
MKRFSLILAIAVGTMVGAPFAGVANASTVGSETGVVTECKCPRGNHYGHCDSNGLHKGHHKKGHVCEEHITH